jgi:hypothetical protein
MSVDGSDEALDSDFDSDSSSDSDMDSGYASAEEDSNEVAEYYNGLIDHYEAEGPTMANHDENTKKMTYPEEERWNKYDYSCCELSREGEQFETQLAHAQDGSILNREMIVRRLIHPPL